MLRISQNLLAPVGLFMREQLRDWLYLAGALATLLFLSVQPSRWRRTVRSVFAGQVMSVGVESVRFTVIVALLVGISVVVQVVVWVGRVGQSHLLGPLLVSVVARELGPLFANFVLIVRGGSAIATEMGLMKVGGEVRVLEAQGIEPLLFLVMPRVIGMAVAAFCLTVIFIVGAFLSGYGFGAFIGQTNVDPIVFLNGVLKAVQPLDGIGIAVKCLLPALLTGLICTTEGLSVGSSVTEVPVAAKHALARSLGALFIVSAVVSLLTYL